MTEPKRFAATTVLVAALATLPGVAAAGGVSVTDTGGAANCVNVQITQSPRSIMDCPEGETYDFCFTRENTDASGLLTGTMTYLNDPSYSETSAVGWDENQAFFHGISTQATAEGDLSAREVGVSDYDTGNYVGLGTVTGGTGRFEGATGSLVIYGNGNGGGLMTGTICMN